MYFLSSLETWFPSLSFSVYRRSHMSGCLFTRALSASSLHPAVSVCVGDGDGELVFCYLIKSCQSSPSSEARVASALHCTATYALKTSNSQLLCFSTSSRGPGLAYTKNLKKPDLRSDFKRVWFLSLTRCQTRLQSCPGKSENKKPKEPFPLSFSIYALTSRSPPLAFPLSAS